MKAFNILLLFATFYLMLIGCNAPVEKSMDATETDEEVEIVSQKSTIMENDGIVLTSVENSPEYQNASLALESPATGSPIPVGTSKFKFNVANYELGVQTTDAESKLCANSGKGQHIHYILDNAPYTAHYTAEFDKELTAGHHVLLAFLSRSYHESLKNPQAAIVTEFDVAAKSEDSFDENAPHLFYSRPKGTYLGADDIKNLLLDFYIINTNLDPNGHKVRATINGTEFMITKWLPYLISGLPEGEVTIKLELLDSNDALVSSPFNPVERSVTLAKEEPLPPK